jgi:predicted ArsR family transcriptional regulator
MKSDNFAQRVAGVAALAEPVRRDLYLFVAGQPDAVSRDQAAAGVGVPRHTAKFHLDRLVSDGLLATEFRRMSGRIGPGAGRPAKLYRRAEGEVAVSLPDRRYDLAAELMARAIEDSQRGGTSVLDALHRAAADRGAELGEQARASAGPEPTRERLVSATCEMLADHGFEPRQQHDSASVTLANCPFHALATEHTELVCGMNLALIDGLVGKLDGAALTATLSPADDRCCVVLAQEQRA